MGSAQWTDNSKDITWTNGSNLKVDDCESGWTGVTNSTVSHPTGTKGKIGSSHLNMVIASGFTTGKAAYKALPSPLTVSAFQQIACYFQTTGSSNVSFKICLCSDTVGDTIVAEISKTLTYGTDFLSSDTNTATWVPVMLDYGSALPGTAINSIAVYFTADPGTPTVRFDGFALCKAPGASDLIDLYSLIGKNAGGETEWYPVTDLAATGVKVTGNQHRIVSGNTLTDRNYRGTTEAVTTYIRNPIKLVAPWTSFEAGWQSVKITVEGGYNSTDMSTKTGETWLCGQCMSPGIGANSASWTHVELLNMGFTYCTTGAFSLPVGQNRLAVTPVFDFLGFIACDTPVTWMPSGSASGKEYRYAGHFDFRCKQVWSSRLPLTTPHRPGNYKVGRVHGCMLQDSTVPWGYAWQPGVCFEFNPTFYDIGKIDNNAVGMKLDSNQHNLKLSGTIIENNTLNFRVSQPVPPAPIRLHFDNMADLMLDGSLNPTAFMQELDNYPTIVRQTRIGGDATKHRTIVNGNEIFESSTAVRHTASGLAWRLYAGLWWTFDNDSAAGAPGHLLAMVACEADKEVTVTCWIYNEFDYFKEYDEPIAFTTATFGIMVLPDIAMELPLIQVEADMTIFGTWQQVTLTFTPGVSGVVPVYAFAYASVLYGDYLTPPEVYSAYFDDVEVTQEA